MNIFFLDKDPVKMMMYIMVNYPMIYALVKDNPPGLSYEGWRSVYKELCK